MRGLSLRQVVAASVKVFQIVLHHPVDDQMGCFTQQTFALHMG